MYLLAVGWTDLGWCLVAVDGSDFLRYLVWWLEVGLFGSVLVALPAQSPDLQFGASVASSSCPNPCKRFNCN